MAGGGRCQGGGLKGRLGRCEIAERIASLVAEISADTKGLEAGLGKTKEGVTGAVGSFTELSSVIGLVKQGAQVVGQVFDETVGKTLAYADEVRGLSQAFSISTEEASKLIQVGDDLGVSADTMKTAFRGMAMQGIAPSLESLKALGAQYRAIQDPADRAQFALKNFGRAGLELSPILLADASAIDASAKSAQEAGQVMSGEAVANARAYEVAVDGLTDSWDGFVYTISNKAIPILTDTLTSIADQKTLTDELRASVDRGTTSYLESVGALYAMEFGLEKLNPTMRLLKAQSLEVTDAMDRGVPAAVALGTSFSDLSALDQSLITDQGRLSDTAIKVAAANATAAHDTDLLAQATSAAASAQATLESNQKGWLSTAADQAIAALDKAGVKGQAYADALALIADKLDGGTVKSLRQQQDIDDLTQKWMDGKLSTEAYGQGLADIQDVYMPKAAGAFDLGKEHLLEFGTQGLDPIKAKLIVDTPAAFLTGSGAAQDFGKVLLTETKTGSGLYVYGVGVQSLTTDMGKLEQKAKDAAAAIAGLGLGAAPSYGGAPSQGTGPVTNNPGGSGNVGNPTPISGPSSGGGGGGATVNLYPTSNVDAQILAYQVAALINGQV